MRKIEEIESTLERMAFPSHHLLMENDVVNKNEVLEYIETLIEEIEKEFIIDSYKDGAIEQIEFGALKNYDINSFAKSYYLKQKQDETK